MEKSIGEESGMLSIEEFKKLYGALGGEPEFEFTFEDRDCAYMVIKYDDHASFQRCGSKDGSGEINYADLDSILESKLIDGINLKRDWGRICDILVNSTISLAYYSNTEDVIEEHGDILYTWLVTLSPASNYLSANTVRELSVFLDESGITSGSSCIINPPEMKTQSPSGSRGRAAVPHQ